MLESHFFAGAVLKGHSPAAVTGAGSCFREDSGSDGSCTVVKPADSSQCTYVRPVAALRRFQRCRHIVMHIGIVRMLLPSIAATGQCFVFPRIVLSRQAACRRIAWAPSLAGRIDARGMQPQPAAMAPNPLRLPFPEWAREGHG